MRGGLVRLDAVNHFGVVIVGERLIKWRHVQRTAAEMKWALTLYNRHPAWLRIDVTLRSIEETSARILKEVSARFGDEHPIMQRQ